MKKSFMEEVVLGQGRFRPAPVAGLVGLDPQKAAHQLVQISLGRVGSDP